MQSIISVMEQKEDLLHGNGASKEEVALAEKALSLSFAQDYREYLLTYGIAAFDGHEFTGISKSQRLSVVEATQRSWELCPQVEKDMYVLEEGMDGIIVWQKQTGEVYSTGMTETVKKEGDCIVAYLGTE